MPYKQNTCFSNPELQIDLLQTDETCSGDDDGQLQVVVLTGVSPYTVSWSNTAAVDTFNYNLASGDYFVTVTDFNGCSVQDSTTIQPGMLFTADMILETSICRFDTTLFDGVSAGTSHDWFVDGNFISNGIDINYACMDAGVFDVVLASTNGICSDTAYGQIEVIHDSICGSSTYCNVEITNGTNQGDFINGVILDTIINTSTGGTGLAPYNDYTAMSTTLFIDSTHQMTITSGDYAQDFYGVWIDFNQDFDFYDAGELVLNPHFNSTSSYQSHSFSFTVPSNALLGSTRMRVVCTNDDATLEPCPSSALLGEVEDYTVYIAEGVDTTSNGIIPISATNDAFVLFPNPASEFVIIRMKNAGSVHILNTRGQLVKKQKIDSGEHKIELDVAPGVYFIEVADKNRVMGRQKLIVE